MQLREKFVVSKPDEGYIREMTLGELTKWQKIAVTNFGFSVTHACPNRCAHCAPESAPELGHTSISLEQAEHWASQMGDLKEAGVRGVNVTGGEPMLLPKVLRVLSEAAYDAGIYFTVVTAAHWARTYEDAVKVYQDLNSVAAWDISTDIWHLPYVSLDKVENAYRAAVDLGIDIEIRFAHPAPLEGEHLELYENILKFADVEHVSCQALRNLGRGKDAFVQIGSASSQQALSPEEELKAKDERIARKRAMLETKHEIWDAPCLSGGAVVKHDGSVMPCCVGFQEVPDDHNPLANPIQLGSAQMGGPEEKRLKDIFTEYVSDPKMLILRMLGVKDFVRWTLDAGLEQFVPEPEELTDICDMCDHLFSKPEVTTAINKKLEEDPELRKKIALMADRVLGESAGLQRFAPEYLQTAVKNDA